MRQTPRDTLNHHTAALKLDLKYTQGIASLSLSADAEAQRDSLSSDWITRFDEAYLSLKPDPSLTLGSGKVALNWGKGYAWNPVGFIQRPKDPNDTTLAREGYALLVVDFIRHFPGDLQTIAFTPVLLPVSSQINIVPMMGCQGSGRARGSLAHAGDGGCVCHLERPGTSWPCW